MPRPVALSERPRPPLPVPPDPSFVATARQLGWALVPTFWMERRLAEIAELKRQLARAANAAATPESKDSTRDSTIVTESHTPREPVG
jgi:hypothetical protein